MKNFRLFTWLYAYLCKQKTQNLLLVYLVFQETPAHLSTGECITTMAIIEGCATCRRNI